MSTTGFDPASWSHWVLIGCFFILATTGLKMAWQWRQERKERRRRSQLARRLAMELGTAPASPHIMTNRLESDSQVSARIASRHRFKR